ncbi:MAG TPA: ABC transporter permease [Acidobacteriota bacterium]|nr:ABC transporter permease [Acidobacteriota bacterium]
MGLFLGYTLRNLTVRKLTTGITIVGLGMVVFVFAAVLMLTNGLKQTLVETGSDNNAIIVRAAANAETVSIIGRDQAGVVTTQPEVALDADGKPLAVEEIVVLVNIDKRHGEGLANTIIRGTTDNVFHLRENIRITAGRMFTPGTSELIAGHAVSQNFKGCELGGQITFAGRTWTIVGLFDSDGSGFDSELWGPIEQVQQAFRRPIFSSITMRLTDPARFDQLKTRLEADPRLTVKVEREKKFYADQSQMTTIFLDMIGMIISVIFSLGAVIGAMITMYGAVANRTVEIGTLRALGFSRRLVMAVFLVEAVWIALLGGVVGVAAASLMSFVTVSTTNWGTFSELSFSFALSPAIVGSALAFAAAMGLIGGFLPAVRASRLRIVNALREE